MTFQQTGGPAVAAAKASISTAAAYRYEQSHRLPSSQKPPRGRRRPDPLVDFFDAEVVPMLDQAEASVASFTADGAYDQEGVSAAVAERHLDEAAETAPTQRDRPLHSIAEQGRAAWQKASGYTKRARAEAAIGRF